MVSHLNQTKLLFSGSDEDPLVTSDNQQRKCTPWYDAGVLGTVAGRISAGVLALEPSPVGSACLT